MNVNRLITKIQDREARIAIVGLGYVGLPLAIAFGRKFHTIGFDINSKRIAFLSQEMSNSDSELGKELCLAPKLNFTEFVSDISSCDVFIIAVPTPVDQHNVPDLSPLLKASETVGSAMHAGVLVVYESTVYPGCTEEDCVPAIERRIFDRDHSWLVNDDFIVGYSPERINPGDKNHTLTNVMKIVSGSTKEALDAVDVLYSSIVEAGVYRASSIKVAEAAKIIENAQRDVNIAFVNELSMMFGRMDIDTHEVLNAAATKWNFLNFRPGLVGGHCIGVDPYYLSHEAAKYGCRTDMIVAARKVNEGMGSYVAGEVVKTMARHSKQINGSNVLILGCTFKENCPDARNSKVFDIAKELQSYGCNVMVSDPFADEHFVKSEYGFSLTRSVSLGGYSAVVVAVAHDIYKKIQFGMPGARDFVLYDVKGFLPFGTADCRL